jgi:hypothetical protein
MGDDRPAFSEDFPHDDSKFPRTVESFLTLPTAEERKHEVVERLSGGHRSMEEQW